MTYIVKSQYTSIMHYAHKEFAKKSDDYKSNIKFIIQYLLTCRYIMFMILTVHKQTAINKRKLDKGVKKNESEKRADRM